MNAPAPKETTPRPFDWLLFSVIVAIGGSAFAMIRGAIDTIPPVVITVARLWIGAIFLYLVMLRAGRRLPPLLKGNGAFAMHEDWRWMISISVIGYIVPFMIFPWSQQYIESGLAGVYMAFMPIWTVALAFLFAGESINARKIVGLVLGFAGVVILIGPGVLGTAATSSIAAQFMLLVATLGYAGAAVITRRAPPIKPRVFAAGTVIAAAILATPALFFVDLNLNAWSLAGVANLMALGLLPTGVGGILLIILIQRTGAGFMALANYLTPLWAVALGAILFGERIGLNALLALAIILCGVAISQTRRKSGGGPIVAQELGEDAIISEKRKQS